MAFPSPPESVLVRHERISGNEALRVRQPHHPTRRFVAPEAGTVQNPAQLNKRDKLNVHVADIIPQSSYKL